MCNLLKWEYSLRIKRQIGPPIYVLKAGRSKKTIRKCCCIPWIYGRNMTCGSIQRFKLSCKPFEKFVEKSLTLIYTSQVSKLHFGMLRSFALYCIFEDFSKNTHLPFCLQWINLKSRNVGGERERLFWRLKFKLMSICLFHVVIVLEYGKLNMTNLECYCWYKKAITLTVFCPCRILE